VRRVNERGDFRVRAALAYVLESRDATARGRTIEESWLAPPRTKLLREAWRRDGDVVPG
jgi:hypothetical protein